MSMSEPSRSEEKLPETGHTAHVKMSLPVSAWHYRAPKGGLGEQHEGRRQAF